MESSSYHLFIVVHPSTAYHTSIVAHHARHTHTHRHAHPHREQRHSSISALQAKLTKSTVAHRRSFRLQPPLQLEERGRPDVVRRSSGRQPPQNKNHISPANVVAIGLGEAVPPCRTIIKCTGIIETRRVV
eukprot:scaffold2172_cov165-Alexandrium_tamarense.AAC.1